MGKKLKVSSGFSLKRMDLAIRGLVNTAFLGNYKSAFKGKGLEFEEYRPYSPSSDDASLIDWKASKRVGQIIVKEFQEERDLDIVLAVDASAQMLTGSTKQLKAEYVAELVSTISQSVIHAGDSVGFMMFSDHIIKEVRPERGISQLYTITNELVKVANYGGYSDVDAVLDHIYKTAEEGSLVIIFSDFVNGINSERTLKLAAKKFDLIFAMVRDPRDLNLPKGSGEVFLEDPHSGSTLLVTPSKIRKEYSREVMSEINRFRKVSKRYGADLLFLQTDKPYVKELMKFLKMREAKWR